MDFLKELFNDGQLDYDTFSSKVNEKGFKLADLSKGDYVSKNKYTDDLANKDNQINTLNGQINQRNTDLENLKQQIENAQGDGQKVSELTQQLTKLQGDYDKEKAKLQKQLADQQMNFAVKEFASKQKFTSKAAEREFISSMIAKNLTIENGNLVGATDYLNSYKADNADSFVVEQQNDPTKPTFTTKTTNTDKKEENPFLSVMHFTGVRKPKE